VTKFRDGAWIIVLLIPALVSIFTAIHRHYKGLARQLSLENRVSLRRSKRNRVIMPVSGVHVGTLQALRYARSLSDDVTAVHVSTDAEETQKIIRKWDEWGEGVRLVVLESPYRVLMEPLMQYIDTIDASRERGETITIVVPQFIPKHWWTNFLHMRAAETLRRHLLNRQNMVITEVPYQVQ
jgi:hypothetical protein